MSYFHGIRPSSLITRFMLFGSIIILITYFYGADLLKLLIPCYEWIVKQFEYRFSTIEFRIIKQHGEQFLLLETTLSRPIFTGNNIIVPNISIPSVASMPLGHVMLPVIIIFTTVLAWPTLLSSSSVQQFLIRFLVAIPVSFFILLIDMPMQLLKQVLESLQSTFGLNISNELCYFMAWSDFLNGGGVIAISVTVALVSLGVAQYLVSDHQ